MIQQFLASSAYQKAETIATYLSFSHEVDTMSLIDQALADGKKIVVPKLYSKEKMEFVVYEAGQLRRNAFSLLEPLSNQVVKKETIDLIHVPGVVFNDQGYRIGYGGGYYDRYLADFFGNTISTIYQLQRHDFQSESHDIAVKEILSNEIIF